MKSQGCVPVSSAIIYVDEGHVSDGVHVVNVQILSLVLRPVKTSRRRNTWAWYHWLVGWSAMVLGTANVVQGLALLGPGRWYVLGYGLAVAAYIGVRAQSSHPQPLPLRHS